MCVCVHARVRTQYMCVCVCVNTRAQVHGQQNMITKLKSMHFTCGRMLLRVRVYDVHVFVCARSLVCECEYVHVSVHVHVSMWAMRMYPHTLVVVPCYWE